MNPIRFLGCCALALVAVGCQAITKHPFAVPQPAWQTKTGQLAYKGTKISLIGEVLVRYSKTGAMELIFSKGPGVNLLTLRQDAEYASAEGPLARGRWSGPVDKAPQRLRGWFDLRAPILAGRNSVQVKSGGESFNLRF